MWWTVVLAISVSALAGLAQQPATAPSRPAGASKPAASKPAAPRIPDLQRAADEFRIQTRNLGLRPDSPAAAKSRTRTAAKWHGRIFENLRNDILDAVPHEIRQRGSGKNLLRRNQFGFNLAGPVVVPGRYNGVRSTFFSISYEGVRERISRAYLRTIPIVPERTGDFSQTVDLSGAPLPVYDPASTRENPSFDAANAVTEENLQYLRQPFPESRIPQSRIDRTAVDALTHYPLPNSDAGPFFRNNYFAVNPETNTANGMIGKLDHSFRDKHRIDLSLAFSNGLAGTARLFPTIADSNPPDRRFTSRRGSIQHTLTVSSRTVHSVEFEAESDGSYNQGDVFASYRFGSYAPMGKVNPTMRNIRNNFYFGNGISTRKGRHALRFGGGWSHQQLNAFEEAFPKGMFRFTAGLTSLPGIINTGHPFASFLLGMSDYAQNSVVSSPSYFRRNHTQIYGRDSWELAPGLTIAGAFNFEVTNPRYEKYDRQSTVDLETINPENGRPGAMVAAARNGLGRGFQPVRVRVEPSASIAWNPLGSRKSVMRASYARSYSAPSLGLGQWGTQAFNAYPSYISQNTQLYPAVTLSAGLPAPPSLPDLRAEALNGMVADLVDRSKRQTRYQSWGFSAERELPSSAVVTLGYLHGDGVNLMVGGGSANPNAVPLDALAYRDKLNDEEFRRTLRPFPQYVGFDLNGQYPIGQYQRDAGYVRLEKRTSSGLGMSAYYEFAKQMDDYSGPYGIQDVYNRKNEWSRAAGVPPQRLTVSYVYELPIGPSKPFLAYTDWRRFVVEGWSISGMTAVNSGDPLALRPQFNNTGGVVGELNANVVPGVDPRVAEPGPDLWFNPAAFAQPADFTVGNASRTHPYLLAPGSQNHDLSLTKRFPLAADRTVELSAVGFNFVNHANWNDPDVVIGPESAPNVNAGKIIGSRGGRVIQVGLRYSF
jgi:hypothetical protein